MANAILRHVRGPEIAYHLGRNPEEAKRIATLHPDLQVMELGMLAAGFNRPAAPAPVSAAPKPITPIKSGDSPAVADKSLEELDASGDMEGYAAKRRRQLAEGRKPGRSLN